MDMKLAHVASRISIAMRRSNARRPLAAVEQVAILLYLKLLDEAEDDYDVAEGRGTVRSTPMFRMQAERYRWRYWRDLPAPNLHKFVREDVLPYMGSLEREEPAVGAFFRDAELSIDEADVLHEIVHEIDALSLTAMLPEEAGGLLEDLFVKLGLRELDGINRTSPALREVMVTMASPIEGESIFDPAMGTGGLLVDAARHVGVGAKPLTLLGSEVSRTLLRIGTVNLALRGLPTSWLRREDAIAEGHYDTERPTAQADVILCDSPFGIHRSEFLHESRYPEISRRLEALFLDLAMRRLSPGGRACILVPDGVLQDHAPGHVALREALVQKFDVLAVLSLPPGRFRAQAGLRSNLLLFRRPSAWSDKPQHVWFYRLGAARKRSIRSNGVEDRTGLADFLRSFRHHVLRDFRHPPGVEARSVLAPGTREPNSWWVSREALAGSSFRLDAAYWAPRIAEWPIDEDPVELVREALGDYRHLIEELERLTGELNR